MNVVTPPQSGVPLVGRESGLNSFFADEKSLLDLLITIRSSKIKDDEKLYLRDLVLEYTQLRDPQKKELVKDELAKLLDKYQITITSPRVAPTQSTTIGVSKKPAKNIFGARRLNPVFRPVAVMTPKSPEVASVAVTNKTHIDPVTNDQIVNKTAEENVMAPHVADPQGRISEIKRLVNSKVGNPINLISSANNIGREYMNALLDAMKKYDAAITTVAMGLPTTHSSRGSRSRIPSSFETRSFVQASSSMTASRSSGAATRSRMPVLG